MCHHALGVEQKEKDTSVFPGNALFIKCFVYSIIIKVYKVSFEVYCIVKKNSLPSKKTVIFDIFIDLISNIITSK